MSILSNLAGIFGWRRSKPAEPITQAPTDVKVYQPEFRYAKTVKDWEHAVFAFEQPGVLNPRYLIELYDSVLLDLHLRGIMTARIIRVAAMPIIVYNEKAEIDQKWTKYFRKSWATKLATYKMQSLFFGSSLMEVHFANKKIDVKLVERRNVCPITKEFIPNIYEPQTRLSYGNSLGSKMFNTETNGFFTLLECCEDDYLGLLYAASLIVLMKRGTLQDWAEFCEKFGMPLMLGFTSSNDTRVKQRMLDALKTLASNAKVVLNDNEKIEVKGDTGRGQSADVYQKLIRLCDEQLSKLVSLQTQTADNGSSYAQAKVHDGLFDDLTLWDKRNYEDFLNEYFLPALRQFIPFPENYEVELKNAVEMPATDMMKMVDTLLQNGYEVPPSYIREEFGIPVSDVVTKPQAAQNQFKIKT